jgi:hypothetical protein
MSYGEADFTKEAIIFFAQLAASMPPRRRVAHSNRFIGRPAYGTATDWQAVDLNMVSSAPATSAPCERRRAAPAIRPKRPRVLRAVKCADKALSTRPFLRKYI